MAPGAPVQRGATELVRLLAWALVACLLMAVPRPHLHLRSLTFGGPKCVLMNTHRAPIHYSLHPRASPLWQIVHHAWDDFLGGYEKQQRRAMGPLRPDAVATVRAFLRCGDLAAGFTRFHCPDCGHEKLLAFTCKSRRFCPACRQRRVRQTGGWIATSVCHEVPHRQFVFTFPEMLRGIFRKRRHLRHFLFQTATECFRDAFRARLGLPGGRIAAAGAL